jgi:hypothetical protein
MAPPLQIVAKASGVAQLDRLVVQRQRNALHSLAEEIADHSHTVAALPPQIDAAALRFLGPGTAISAQVLRPGVPAINVVGAPFQVGGGECRTSRGSRIWKRCQMSTANCSECRASDVVGRPAPGKLART